jgi:hypothetical protein
MIPLAQQTAICGIKMRANSSVTTQTLWIIRGLKPFPATIAKAYFIIFQ